MIQEVSRNNSQILEDHGIMLQMRRGKRSKSSDEALLALNEERAKRARTVVDETDTSACRAVSAAPKRRHCTTKRGTKVPETSSAANPLFALLPTEIVENIALFLAPRDRFNLGMTCRETKSIVWNEALVWDQIAHSVQNSKYGVSTRDIFLYEQRRRNRQFVSMRRILLKTFYQCCVGCETKRSGEEKITGLGLCADCLSNHPILGVCSRSKAKKEYFLCDKDLEELGERSAVLEYDCNRLMVHRVHFYRRALRKKALEKYGGTAGFRREVTRRARNHERRQKVILQRRERRSFELSEALAAVNMTLCDVLAPCLPRMEVSQASAGSSSSVAAPNSPFFLEDLVDFLFERFLNQPRYIHDDVVLLVQLVQAKAIFRAEPELRVCFLKALCSGMEGYTSKTQVLAVAMLKLSALKSTSADELVRRMCQKSSRDASARRRRNSGTAN